MSLSPYVFDATASNFQRLVLENSHRGLVLVHFWTPKAGPCMVLMPRLVRLATEFGGKFLLVMLNTDELGRLARTFGVTSVPTVKLFRQGEVIHTVHGAESEQHFRDLLNRFILQDAIDLYAQGLGAGQTGRYEESKRLLAAAAVEEPENPAIPRDLAKLLWSHGEREQALSLLESLPAPLRENRELRNLRAHFALALASGLEKEPEDPAESTFRLAAQQLSQDDMEAGLDTLLSLHIAQPDYRNALPLQALQALFDHLGDDHPLSRQFRDRLNPPSH